MFSKHKLCSLILRCHLGKGYIPVLIYCNKHTNSQAKSLISKSEKFFTAVSIRAASDNSAYQNIYLCTFRDADISMVLRCTRKYQALLDGIISG